MMVLIAAVPGYVLGRWFDRQPAARRRPAPRTDCAEHTGANMKTCASAASPSRSARRGAARRRPQRPAGSFTAILGASGSGKTTLLRVVAGFERPDDGRGQLGDEVVDDAGHHFVPSEHRRIGYVPQEGALFPHLSVGRNIAFGLAPRPGPPRAGSPNCSSWSACPARPALPPPALRGPAAAGRPGARPGHRARDRTARRTVLLARRRAARLGPGRRARRAAPGRARPPSW